MKSDLPALLAPPGLSIDIDGLGRSFDGRQVLADLDLHIPSGEFVAIVGRSGCGKSTLLRLLSGLDAPTHGGIKLDGVPQKGIHGALRIMFQDSRLLPWKSVLDNVSLGLQGDRKQIRAQALDALAQVGLADRAGEWPARLSGGQRQRVALARALIHGPRLLLLDEPLGALDALTRIEMQDLIERLWRQHGFTAVLVTHDVSEAVALADRVLLIENGRVTLDRRVDLGRPRERGEADFAALEHDILKRLTRVEAINARNQQKGKVARIIAGKVISEVHVETPGGIVIAAVSTRELREQPLETGAQVLALFKSTEVMLATPMRRATRFTSALHVWDPRR
ncbi:ATP-binding cassette domain-containing protein [Bordetella sp.]|uniref:ATP-binding cassette domain-containing protein n=1 Tax=Bordetella sp. TaxID=28081 RepID=UPI0039C86C48